MTKKKAEQVSECTQCMGDELLEVRRDASQLHEVMGVLSQAFPLKRHKHGTTVLQYVNALVETHGQYEKALHSRRFNAERKVREAEDLIAALRFISQACKSSSGGVTVGGDALTVGMDKILSVVIGRVQSLIVGDKGCSKDFSLTQKSIRWRNCGKSNSHNARSPSRKERHETNQKTQGQCFGE